MKEEIIGYQSKPKTPKKTPTGEQKRKPHVLFIVIIVLIVTVIATIGYLYFNRKQFNEEIQLQQQQIIKLQTQLQQLTLQHRQLMVGLQKLNVSQQSQLLANAIYSLQQAQLQLQLYTDVPTTITTLKKVANRIEPFNGRQLSTLAAAIHQDIKKLRAIKLTNVHTLQQQFSALSQDIEALQLYQPQSSKQTKPREYKGRSWQKVLHDGWHALSKVVIVKRTDSAFTPLMQQQQLLSFKQYLQSLAQQAFWGALHHDNVFYHQRLHQMQQALHQYLSPTDQQWQLLQARLVKLQQETVAVAGSQQLHSLMVAQQLQIKNFSVVQEQTK